MKRLAILLAVLVGCDSSNPETSVLPAGSEAVVVGESAHHLADSGGWVSVEPGSRVRIGHDPGVYQETPEDVENRAEVTAERQKEGLRRFTPPDPMSGFRQVRVVVESGPGQGKAGTLSRNDLRPVK